MEEIWTKHKQRSAGLREKQRKRYAMVGAEPL